MGGSGARHSALPATRILPKHIHTSADGFVATVVGLEVGSEFLKLGLASLGGHDALVGEDDGLRPLSRSLDTSVIF